MRWLVSILFLLICTGLKAQHKVYLADIEVSGLKRTKYHVLMNELEMRIGDSLDISELAYVLERNEQRLLSTGLFNLADINIKHWDEVKGSIGLSIEVKENWYIYPAPIFELADRSFNVWWKEMNCDLDRVNYGVRIDHLNTTGRKDKLKLKFQLGYTRKYEIDYSYPYLFGTWGFGALVSFSENKEIGYRSLGNKVLFKKYDDERVLLRRFRTGVSATKRSNAFAYHFFRLEYHYNTIADVVTAELNPNYYPDGDDYIRYLKLEYILKYNRTIFPTYPEGGYAFAFEARKDGFGFGNFENMSTAAEFEYYFKPAKSLILGAKIKGKVNLQRSKVPYSNYGGIGYGADVLRGYELYVMDGADFVWLKTSARIKLLDRNFNLGKYMPAKAFNVMAVCAFLKFTWESGYAHDPFYATGNAFNNRWLSGYGPGIDVWLYNNFLLSVEYNFNHVGEGEVFYKSKLNF
ncbi:MAG: hypothetical protein IPN29_17405 [Saprospiraceae bacterium]|nr:hypothetical protein [Saprospiraceae bacterium]